MKDIRPWLDDGASRDVAAMLEAARDERPREALAEHALSGLSPHALDGLAASDPQLWRLGKLALGGKAQGFSVAVLAKWGGTGLLVGALSTTSIEAARRLSAPPPPASPTIARTRPAAERAHAPAVVEAQPASAAPSEVADDRASSPGPSVHSSARSPQSDALAREIDLLDRARTAVDAGRFDRALSLLGEHDRSFGASAPLSPEARYLKLESLLKAHRDSDARAAAREILRLDPHGPHLSRAEEILKTK